LISIDGFRANYLELGVTPTLTALADAGVRARSLRPSFPSSTYPNHYTLVTGLRPDVHGIVANTMEDPRLGRFTLGDRASVRDHRWWDAAEPIWVSAERAGLPTAPLNWPGSEAAIRGVRPTIWVPFHSSASSQARVDQLLATLEGGESRRPVFATLYLDEVDHAGHDFGPESAQTVAALRNADAAISRLISGLRSRGVAADIIIVSDHGMASTPQGNLVRLDAILPAGSYRAISTGAFATIMPLAGNEQRLYAALPTHRPHVRCWRKQSVPARLHYGHNVRVPPVFCLADVGWLITDGPGSSANQDFGAHGYDNFHETMAGIFIASGPSFLSRRTIGTLDNVKVAPLLRHLLRLSPTENRLPSTIEAVLVPRSGRR
jgi:predicted AlkP superfamily pyrophosphatase or phosphodiesterase